MSLKILKLKFLSSQSYIFTQNSLKVLSKLLSSINNFLFIFLIRTIKIKILLKVIMEIFTICLFLYKYFFLLFFDSQLNLWHYKSQQENEDKKHVLFPNRIYLNFVFFQKYPCIFQLHLANIWKKIQISSENTWKVNNKSLLPVSL